MTHQAPRTRDPRPAPTGERVWPGERPFTDFGQWGYGHLDLRVFDDGNQIWCDIFGAPHRPRDMTPDYRTNVLAFLESNAPYFHLMTIQRHLIEVYSDLADGRLDPRDLDRVRALIEVDPVTWITTTSIARALRNAH